MDKPVRDEANPHLKAFLGDECDSTPNQPGIVLGGYAGLRGFPWGRRDG
jgi:hypothetical protein